MQESLSSMEQGFERLRARAGWVLAPLVFLGIFFAPLSNPPLEKSTVKPEAAKSEAVKSAPKVSEVKAPAAPKDLSPEAHKLAAILGLVVVLWITEILPMAVTALLGACLCVLFSVAPAKVVFAPFANPLMFLFIGSFIIAQAIMYHGLDRRMAFGVLSLPWVGASPSRLLFAFGAVTAAISAFISNTATTAMMYAIGLGILRFLYDEKHQGTQRLYPRYATGMMLMTAFAASVGGLATPIGTPPNVIGLGFIRDHLNVDFTFFKWCAIGVPVVIALYMFIFVLLNFFCSAGVKQLEGAQELIRAEREKLGAWTAGQYAAAAAFLITAALWIAPGVVAIVCGESSPLYKQFNAVMPEGVAALLGASLLFILPGSDGARAMTWAEASRIDWGVVFLYGGGFALGELSFQTGLAEYMGLKFTGWLPIAGGGMVLLIAATLIAVICSEFTSNTASANMVVPVVIAIARASGADALEAALGATIGASLGFMMPVSTPCNAIVYGSGYVPLSRMIRYGVLLDIFGAVVVVLMVKTLVPMLR